ncbi:MAG: cyclic nucleotide-binding domain-containing protein [Gammaproteobacteria bacterium]|nr:cyclic nucleotide-binding domain-containing protein [Gammaproteobacteria bacterium]
MSELHERFHDLMRLLVPINSLPPKHQDQLLKGADVLQFKKKEYVFRQGDRDAYSFYLLEGHLDLYADDQLIKEVEGGTGPAFNALAQLQPRQLSARARTPVTVLRVDRGLLERLLTIEDKTSAPAAAIEVTEIEVDDGGDWLTALLQSELFSRVPPSNIQRLLDTMESVEMKQGDVVVRQGDPGDYYYIVQRGRCEVTRRTSSGSNEIRLAELRPGDSFGEEALVADSRRNASVRMLTDGELVRLTKQDFIELIKKPVLHSVSYEQACQLVAAGAVWLDVRQPEEHRENGLPDSVNVPLNLLRLKSEELDPQRAYVAYCDSGGRSSVAAFLLTERGFDAHYVDAGCVAGIDVKPAQARPAPPAAAAAPEPPVTPKTTSPPPAATAAAPTAPAPVAPESEPVSAADRRSRDADEDLDAEVRASALKAELARASLQLAEAQRLKQEAEKAKREAERFVAEKLRSERERVEAQARKAEEMLRAAQRLQGEIEVAKQRAESEAERRRSAEEERIKRLHAEAAARMQAEEARLQDVYRRNTEEIENIQRLKAEAEVNLASERERLEAQSADTHRRLEEALRKEQALESEAERLLAEQNEREKELQESARRTLAAERRKLEAEFARTAHELEQTRRERAAAQAAREAAQAEAENIISEFKQQHDKVRAAEYAKIERERLRLKKEAERIAAARIETQKAREAAEKAQRELETQRAVLATERERSVAAAAQTSGRESALRAEIEAVEARAAAAARQLEQAERARVDVEARQRANEERLERTYESQGKLDDVFRNELEEWIAEQERLQSSTLGRDKIKEQIEISDRIKRSADVARKSTSAHDQALLEELAAVLDTDA